MSTTLCQLTKNFNASEFQCKDGSGLPLKFIPNLQKLAENLQVLRDHLSKPIHVNSGYRSVSYNNSVGGSPRSQHLQAKASDITCQCLSPLLLRNLIEELIHAGVMAQGGLGLYKNFVHYDIRGTKARWDETINK